MENTTDTPHDPVVNESKSRKTLAWASLILGFFGFLALCLGLGYWWLGSYIFPFPSSWTVDQGLLILLLITVVGPSLLSLAAIVVGALVFRRSGSRRGVVIAGIAIGVLTIVCLAVPLVQLLITWLFAHSNQPIF
jgi:hypothetical protein